MQTFTSARDAKEFLAGRIVTEAQQEGISLSEVERKMLYFSETAWTLPDILTVNDAFDRDYDQERYEQKIAMLSRNFCANAEKNKQDDLDSWNAAVRTLGKEDHYLLVLIAATRQSSVPRNNPFGKLLLIGAALAVLALTITCFLVRR